VGRLVRQRLKHRDRELPVCRLCDCGRQYGERRGGERADPSGDFGPVTITNPITINGNGNDASIDFAGDGEGVYVDMSTPGTARLEGLDINGEGTGDDAVFDEGATVEIDNCDLDGFTDIGVGIGDDNTTDPAGDSAVITNTTIDGGELGVRNFQSSGFVGTGAITLDHDTLENVTGSTGDAAIFTRFGDSVTVDNTSFYNNETDYEADTQNWNATFDDDVMTGTTTPVFTLYTIGGVTSNNLEVDNSQITANDGAVFGDDGGVYTAELTGDEIEDNPGGGVLLNANSTLDDDTITGNGDYGLEGGGPASIDDSTIDDNAAGVLNTGGTMAISNSTIDGNTGDGVSGATALDILLADTVSQNGTGIESDTGGQIVALGASNSIYGNTTNGSPNSTVTTGAVGLTGGTGTSGPQGIPGTNGAQGPAGSVGPAGTNGSQGPAGTNGEIELVTCTNTKKKVKHKTVTQKKCTSKLVSSPVSFTASVASARISCGSPRGRSAGPHRRRLRAHRAEYGS
jgi:parallel beta helix pectate lyase-like protein/collagen triple helix repeat protein